MRNLLADANREVLAQFAWSNVLLAFDFDGTLAPIVARPEAAALRAGTHVLLRKLARVYPCVVISGRAQADVTRRLSGTGAVQVLGNNGLRAGRRAAPLAQQVGRWVEALRAALAEQKGVEVEDKVYSVAVHYRRSREKRRARAAIEAVVRDLADARVVSGKQVVNVLPEGAPHKGMALRTARERLRCDTAIYVGDDESDEDVFSLDEPGRLLAVRVGRKESSQAEWFIPGQGALDRLLQALLVLRESAPLRTEATV